MKEIRNILNAFAQAQKEGKRAALATVVQVEGSSYRRPGTRMLVTEDGQLTGAFGNGCLEGDALKKALAAISEQQNKLVTYDTSEQDDAKFGVQLGCTGIIRVLFEPIQSYKIHNPIELLRQVISVRQDTVLVSLFSLEHDEQPGTCLLYRTNLLQSTLPLAFQADVIKDAQEALETKTSSLKQYNCTTGRCNGFIQFIPPPIALVIAGAGNDVQPLVEISAELGWYTMVVDGRATHATAQRFARADRVVVAKPAQVVEQLPADVHTVFVLMTHNYNYDLALLQRLLDLECAYIGVLGPRKKLNRMLDELQENGITLSKKQEAILHGPVGLDIGAETAEEIAVSIVAEIKAVLSGRSGKPLKDKAQDVRHHRLLSTAGMG